MSPLQPWWLTGARQYRQGGELVEDNVQVGRDGNKSSKEQKMSNLLYSSHHHSWTKYALWKRYHQGKPASRNGGDKKAARGDGQHDIIYLKKKRRKKWTALWNHLLIFFYHKKNLQVILADTVDSQLAKNMAVFVIYLYSTISIAIIFCRNIVVFIANHETYLRFEEEN